MTHVVAGYPSKSECVELMRGMEKAGVGMIEVQIPFSDPIADGETIMRANDVALDNGMTTRSSFEMIKKADLKIDVYGMSYYQKIFSFDVDAFCSLAKSSGVKGLIVPDLPADAPDFEDFIGIVRKYNLSIVPVISPGMNQTRLKNALANTDDIIYLTSMKGITGKSLKLNKELVKTAKTVKKIKPNIQLAIGFGISSKQDLDNILKIASAGVVGSAIIKTIGAGGEPEEAIKFIQTLIA